MKKTLLSLTAAALLCTALPQQTLAGCFGDSKRSDDMEMTTYGNYASVPTYDGESEPPNTCSQLLSNAGHTVSSTWDGIMQSSACDKTWKKALWITGGIVGGGLVISGYWWVPAVTTAIASTASTTLAPFTGQNDSAVPAGNGNPAPSFDCTKAPKLSQCLIEDAIEELQQNGALPLEMAQDLTLVEARAVAEKSGIDAIPISSENFETCTNLKPFEWPSYMARVEPLSEEAAWNKLNSIAQTPKNQFGNLRSAGEVAHYSALSKQQIGDLLDVTQSKGALGMRVTIDGTPIDATCSRVFEAAQKLTQCPDAWNKVKQAAYTTATPSHYTELIQAAEAGHNLGDISNSRSIPNEEIKGAMSAALRAGKLGLFYQVNGENVPYACYSVLRNHAARFGAQVPQEDPVYNGPVYDYPAYDNGPVYNGPVYDYPVDGDYVDNQYPTGETELSSSAKDLLQQIDQNKPVRTETFTQLSETEQQVVNQHWLDNQTPDTPFYFIDNGIPCRVDRPADVEFCRKRTVNTMSEADMDTNLSNKKVTLEMLSTIPQEKLGGRIKYWDKWQYIYNSKGQYLCKDGSSFYFFEMDKLRDLPWHALIKEKEAEGYTWY